MIVLGDFSVPLRISWVRLTEVRAPSCISKVGLVEQGGELHQKPREYNLSQRRVRTHCSPFQVMAILHSWFSDHQEQLRGS